MKQFFDHLVMHEILSLSIYNNLKSADWWRPNFQLVPLFFPLRLIYVYMHNCPLNRLETQKHIFNVLFSSWASRNPSLIF